MLKRSNSKRDQARKAVAKKTKRAKRWGIKKVLQRVIPKRVLVVAGGAVAAAAGAVALKKRGGSGDAPPPPAVPPTGV